MDVLFRSSEGGQARRRHILQRRVYGALEHPHPAIACAGWLAGARDPEAGKALAFLHRHPAQAWIIADLAREAGLSRSVLAERFRHYLGEPPMSYLTRWRKRLRAKMLKSRNHSVAEIADEVGYAAEAAFNRVFKREYQVPPARFRVESRGGTHAPLQAHPPRH